MRWEYHGFYMFAPPPPLVRAQNNVYFFKVVKKSSWATAVSRIFSLGFYALPLSSI